MNISPLAVVHPEAKIGQNTTVDPFAVIEKDVVIGDNCRIYSHATILDGARIGNNCQVFPGAVIAGIPQDLKFKGEITTAEIGNNTILRECVTVNRGTASKGKTVVGNNCLIMAYSHIAHDCLLKDNIIIGNECGRHIFTGFEEILHFLLNAFGLLAYLDDVFRFWR